MKLDNEHPPGTGDLLAPSEWTMEVTREGSQWIAVVKCSGETKCRLSIASSVDSEWAAQHALADKARHWTRDFLGRTAKLGVRRLVSASELRGSRRSSRHHPPHP